MVRMLGQCCKNFCVKSNGIPQKTLDPQNPNVENKKLSHISLMKAHGIVYNCLECICFVLIKVCLNVVR